MPNLILAPMRRKARITQVHSAPPWSEHSRRMSFSISELESIGMILIIANMQFWAMPDTVVSHSRWLNDWMWLNTSYSSFGFSGKFSSLCYVCSYLWCEFVLLIEGRVGALTRPWESERAWFIAWREAKSACLRRFPSYLPLSLHSKLPFFPLEFFFRTQDRRVT